MIGEVWGAGEGGTVMMYYFANSLRSTSYGNYNFCERFM
jgi:hypothetical protein